MQRLEGADHSSLRDRLKMLVSAFYVGRDPAQFTQGATGAVLNLQANALAALRRRGWRRTGDGAGRLFHHLGKGQ